MVQPLWKTFSCFIWSAIWLLPKGVKNLCSPKNLHYTRAYIKYIAALFIIVKTWKQPRHPSVGEWIKKKNRDTRREWNSIQYRKEMSHQDMNRRGGNLKFILLSERSLSEKATYVLYYSNYKTLRKKAKLWRL